MKYRIKTIIQEYIKIFKNVQTIYMHIIRTEVDDRLIKEATLIRHMHGH